MQDDIWARDEPQSPCIKLCSIHPETRICVGCYRTIDEISAWSRLSVEARRDLLASLPERAAQHKVRRGGRTGRAGRLA